MRKEGGVLEIVDPDAREMVLQIDTFTCAHCNALITVPPRTESIRVNVCKKCMGRVCQDCTRFGCDPIERKLERYEAKARGVYQQNLDEANAREQAERKRIERELDRRASRDGWFP